MVSNFNVKDEEAKTSETEEINGLIVRWSKTRIVVFDNDMKLVTSSDYNATRLKETMRLMMIHGEPVLDTPKRASFSKRAIFPFHKVNSVDFDGTRMTIGGPFKLIVNKSKTGNVSGIHITDKKFLKILKSHMHYYIKPVDDEEGVYQIVEGPAYNIHTMNNVFPDDMVMKVI